MLTDLECGGCGFRITTHGAEGFHLLGLRVRVKILNRIPSTLKPYFVFAQDLQRS